MEKRDSDRVLDNILRDEVRRLNLHLPKTKKTLRELLEQESPEVPSVDGRKIIMRRSELEELASTLPSELLDKVRLPMVLIRRGELGAGAFTVLGDKPEEFAVSRLLGSFQSSFEDFKHSRQNETVVYKPQVSELIRKYHSLIVVGFGVAEDASSQKIG